MKLINKLPCFAMRKVLIDLRSTLTHSPSRTGIQQSVSGRNALGVNDLSHWQRVYIALGLTCLGTYSQAAPPGSFLLKINMTPAICRLDNSQKRTRQCLEGYAMTVNALIPDNYNAKSCSTKSTPILTPVQKRLVTRIMPDEADQFRLWRSVGACAGMSAPRYFRTMTNAADHLKMPAEVTSSTTIRVGRMWLRQRFVQLNPGMGVDGINFTCVTDRSTRISLLTHVNVCYTPNGNFRSCTGARVITCGDTLQITGSY